MLSAEDLPSLPEALTEILRVCNEEDATISKVEGLVARDISLAARVLKIANSVIYGSRTVASIHHAVRMLGLRELKGIAMSLAVAPAFRNVVGSLIDGATLWQHSLATALWSQHITALLCFPRRDEVFTAALMHDVGLLVLAKTAPKKLEQSLAQVLERRGDQLAAEREIIGLDHAAVGALVCTKWRLPANLVQIVADHHTLPPGANRPALAILSLAEHFAARMGLGEFPWLDLPTEWDADLLDAVGLGVEDADGLLGQTDIVRSTVDELIAV
jgi:putative nucleotidyltransferase with HDIG domain